MSREVVFVLEPDAGRVTVEASHTPNPLVRELRNDLGQRIVVNCGRPAPIANRLDPAHQPQESAVSVRADDPSIYLFRLYHYSTVDGPGRRSVVQVSGCSIRCQGCYVPETHNRSNGVLTPISAIVSEIEAKRKEHDGVTILGGEPFDQAEALAVLVGDLKEKNLHLTLYTGYNIENLRERDEPCISDILFHIDLLIDGPYIRELAKNAGEYRGSSNQRLILLGNIS